MIPVEEAVATILSNINVLGKERVCIKESLYRILAEDIYAPYNIPLADNSAVDGYALKASDISGSSKDKPSRLEILGTVAAGSLSGFAVEKGKAIRIMTGACVPEGADTVVMKEDAAEEGSCVLIFADVAAGGNIRRAGEDVKEGSLLFKTGSRLKPAHIGVLASIKRSVISVYQRPRVAIMSTGDELIDVDGKMQKGKIVSSNSYSLAALVAEKGALPVVLEIAADNKESLKKCLSEGLNADILISSGGVSVGDYDYVKDVLKESGTEMKFWKVAMRPGQPLAFGVINGKPVFGLPGNPVSVMISFEQFVTPSVRKMSGMKNLFRQTVEAIIEEDVTTKKGKKYFLRARLFVKDGTNYVTTTGPQGSGILMSMAEANSLIIISEDRDIVPKGDTVLVQVLDPEWGWESST